MKNKKGQLSSLGGLQGVIVTLIVVSVLVVTGFFVVQEFLEQDQFSDSTDTVENEVGYINSTGYTLDEADSTAFNSPSITSIVNYTDGTSISDTEYTLSESGVLTNATATTYNNVSMNYSYKYGEGSYEGVNDTMGAMQTIPELLGLIILIVVIGIVLAVVFNVVPGARMTGA